MKIGLKMVGLEKAQKQLEQLTGPQFREAAAKAINDAAGKVQREMKAEITQVFDRPTRYISNSVWVERAKPDNLNAIIAPTYARSDTSFKPLAKGGKMGVDPQQILRAQEAGGTRRDKKSEVILRRAGYLPAGHQTVIPVPPFPGSVDEFGNIKGSFISQVLSFLQLAGEQGYFKNMKTAGKANLKAYGSAARPQKTTVGPRLGRQYIVTGGLASLQLEGGDRMVMRTTGGERTKHLPKGIWAKLGTGRGTLKPVLLFVKTPYYRPLLDMASINQQADADNYLAKRLRYRIREAAGV